MQSAKPKVKEKKTSGALSNSSGTNGKGKVTVGHRPSPLEVEMARQDLLKVVGPDIQRPFSSLEDACERLLPYHILADYEFEDIDEKEDGQPAPRSRAWQEYLKARTAQYMATLEMQVNTYNAIIKNWNEGLFRGEERMMIEQSLLFDEKQKLINLRAQIEAQDRAQREAAEAKEALVQAEKARAEEQARAQAQAQADAARQEAEIKAEALRAETEAATKPENILKHELSSSAGQPLAPANVVGKVVPFTDGSWTRMETEDQDVDEEEDEVEEVEEVWEEDVDDDEEDDDDEDDDDDDEDDDDEEDDSDSTDDT